MGKYDHLKTLKETKARTHHVCFNCGNNILPGETYYREYIEDKFLHSLHAKKYCSSCYEKLGNIPLSSKMKSSIQSISLDEFDKGKVGRKMPFTHDSSVAVAPSSSPCGFGAYNKRVSGSLRCTRSTQICSHWSQTSDTPQPLYEIVNFKYHECINYYLQGGGSND